MIDLINSIPDELRMTDTMMVCIRILASLFGWRIWEDGSVGQ